jgi:hypothetical protein
MINIIFGKMENVMSYNATADSADLKRISSGISSLASASLKPKNRPSNPDLKTSPSDQQLSKRSLEPPTEQSQEVKSTSSVEGEVTFAAIDQYIASIG